MTIRNEHVNIKKKIEVKDKIIIRGPLDKFISKEKTIEDSLTMSDFECDSVDLDLSDIVNGIIVS